MKKENHTSLKIMIIEISCITSKLHSVIDGAVGGGGEGEGAPHVPTQKTKIEDPLDFSTTPNTPLKRLWKRLCIYFTVLNFFLNSVY